MERMKKFFIYFILFVGLYLFVNLMTNLGMRENYKSITNHEILVKSPKVTVVESKATYSYGYIKGNISNDTGEHITEKYLQFDFYDKDGIYVGTETKEIKYFNVDETINFDLNYEYTNVNKIKISFVNEVKKPPTESFNILNIEDETLKIALPIAAALGLFIIIP